METLLKLIAFDEEDLGVLSFQVHNAHFQVKDILRQTADKRFMLVLNRFDWEEALITAEEAADKLSTDAIEEGEFTEALEQDDSQEIPALLCFDHVKAVRYYGIDRNEGERVLSLKGICFHQTSAPSGTIDFLFSENIGLQCDVECIEARLEDLPEIE